MYNDFFKRQYKKVPLAISSCSGEDTLPHIHREFEMVYIAKGQAEVKIGADSFTAQAGDIIFANPMEVHSLTYDKGQEYMNCCICFDTSLIFDRTISDELTDGTISVAHIIKSNHFAYDNVRNVFLKLFKAAENDMETLPLEAAAYVSLIFAEIIKADLISKVIHRDKKSVFYSTVIKYIAQNYSREITSADPAKELFYTQSHFCRVFNQKFGTSFSVFLNMYRVSRAKEMLETPNIKISRVAEKCGFENISYFSRCFKNIVGISPTEYKKYQYGTNKPSNE